MFINLISSNEKKKNLGNNASIHEDHRIFNNVQKWQTTPKSSLECEDLVPHSSCFSSSYQDRWPAK